MRLEESVDGRCRSRAETRATRAQSQAIFDQLGLTGSFWCLPDA
jgi:hypothetical protein